MWLLGYTFIFLVPSFHLVEIMITKKIQKIVNLNLELRQNLTVSDTMGEKCRILGTVDIVWVCNDYLITALL